MNEISFNHLVSDCLCKIYISEQYYFALNVCITLIGKFNLNQISFIKDKVYVSLASHLDPVDHLFLNNSI